jgi:hypothetical protein
MRPLFPAPSGVSDEDLLDYYGTTSPPNLDNPPVFVDLETLRSCMATAPTLSSPQMNGWRIEHLVPLAADPACGEALVVLMIVLMKGEVSDKVGDLLSSAILVALLK